MSIVINGNKNLKFIKAVYYQPVMPPPPPLEKYLTIEALEDDFYISYTDCFYENGFSEEDIQQLCDESGWEYEKIQYSFDKIDWYILEPWEPTPSINTGEKIYLKRRFITPGLFEMMYMPSTQIFCDYQYNLSGNCNSILFGDGDGELFDGCFFYLFGSNSGLVNISKSFLPNIELAYMCYSSMFDGCESLVTAPELPATELADECYSSMFYNCTSLVTAPELPATTLTGSCYANMFYGCTSLVTAPELPATTLAFACYGGMFSGTNLLPDCTNIDFTSESVVTIGGLNGLFAGTNVTDEDLYNILPINPSTGKYWLPVTELYDECYSSMFYNCTSLVTAPELPATTLAYNCYASMFYNCTSLVTAPELPATELADECYYSMFYNCTSLINAPTLPATTLEWGCYSSMFNSCESLVTAPELPATTLADECYYSMFYNCTSLVTAPELPATTLDYGCYNGMFSGCSKLNYIKALFTTTPNSNYTYNWVNGVPRTGTFVKNKNATWNVTGTSGIPNGWTVQTA